MTPAANDSSRVLFVCFEPIPELLLVALTNA
jgi:hypothetical protein